MDKMQVQAAIAALYGADPAESARANTFLMEFAEQPVTVCFEWFQIRVSLVLLAVLHWDLMKS